MGNGEYQITDALQMMLDKNAKIKISRVDKWLDCGTFESLRKTSEILKGN